MFKKIVLLFSVIIFSSVVYSQEVADTKYWVIFKDKGEFKPDIEIDKNSAAYEKGKEILSERSIKRRLKVLSEDNLIDYKDLPLNSNYVAKVKYLNIELISQSRWLNGVSAYLTKSQLEKIKALEYVSQIKAVNKLYKQQFLDPEILNNTKEYSNIGSKNDSGNIYNYGNSYRQMEMVNVPRLHDMNITGKNVMIAIFDDGFDWKHHEALKNLKVKNEFDFINADPNTFYEQNQKYPDSRDQGQHGTATLSSMSGFKNGKLLGPAFDSDILLAKTEYVSSETPMEEDFFLEAAEWAEAQGTDIITSSLIYKQYDAPYEKNSYSYDNYDGKTAITTLAAARSAYLGIVVCQAMGNYEQTAIPSLGSAADADSIISVGAVTYSGNPASFTSNGPTKDGRTKPDVVAPGVGVFVAVVEEVSGNETTYEYSNGTSFSTPITAGVAALILSVHPELTPMEVRDALRNTASLSNSPNNTLGWGVVNAYDAVLYNGPAWSNDFRIEKTGDELTISTYLASKDLIDPNTVKFNYSFDNGQSFKTIDMKLSEPSGDENNSGLYTVTFKLTENMDNFKSYFSAEDYNGKKTVSKDGIVINSY
ncbi:MAG TPA: S8 family serine peptidase [Ignavibacteria bacterium]|nr:S8 family serine peptidase [Ignavibacteria bacterium]